MAAAAVLPDDVLADVLRRLEPRSLAASRCVCKAWRAVIEARRLQLCTDPLPRSLAGIYVGQPTTSHAPRFFARRPSLISGSLHFLPSSTAGDEPPPRRRYEIQGHCNGLLLLGDPDNRVVNPATRWWSPPLPPRPPPRMGASTFVADLLVYDPAVSSRYGVFSIPCFRRNCSACYCFPPSAKSGDEPVPLNELSEWPPLLHTIDVYSSSSGRWEERTFNRQGEAAGTIADMRFDLSGHKCKSVYWQGALYVHYKTYFIMRISLSDGKYQVIKMPMVRVNGYPHFCLGRSEKGVYLALVTKPRLLQVWVLNESCDKIVWVLKHAKDLNLVFPRQTQHRWILHDLDKEIRYHEEESEENLEWSSDDDNNILRRVPMFYHGNIDVLGFHPYKEIIFLCEALQKGMAYHLNTSKIDILGKLHLASSYDEILSNKMFTGVSSIYTLLDVIVFEEELFCKPH